MTITAAHTQTETLHLLETYPAHEPRKSDPHYAAFNQARKRLTKLGALICWINNADCKGPIELHHATVEFSLANIVDATHFRALYPEFQIKSDADFLLWVESEGNLLPLCGSAHHRGVLGIHSILYSPWLVQRFLKAGVTAPERKVTIAKTIVKTMPPAPPT